MSLGGWARKDETIVYARASFATGPSLAAAQSADPATLDLALVLATPHLLTALNVPPGLTLAGGVVVHRVTPWADITPSLTVDVGATLYDIAGGDTDCVRTPSDFFDPVAGRDGTGLRSGTTTAIAFPATDPAPNGTTDDAWFRIVLIFSAVAPSTVTVIDPT